MTSTEMSCGHDSQYGSPIGCLMCKIHSLEEERTQLQSDLQSAKKDPEPTMSDIFVRHIRGHLNDDELVVCKICEKSALDIHHEFLSQQSSRGKG